MKFSNLIVLLLLVSSCSSYKYNSAYEDKKVIIKSENLNQYDVVDAATGSKIIRASSQESNVVIPDLRKKTVKLQLVHENYDMIELMIYRSPRGKALVKDLSLGLFTFGLPLWIDFFRSDFYKVSEKTKEFNVHFDYKQSFMKSELEKISKSKRPSDFQDWINKYPKSDQMIRAVDKRDSLEFQIALGMESEIAIDDFISGHSVSSYLDDATAVKNEMVEARELFDDAKNKNNVIAYEKFLEKFPRSLHNKDAHRRLVDAAEKEAKHVAKSINSVNYINDYLIPNKDYFSTSEIKIKVQNISKEIDTQLISENISTDSKLVYQSYSNLWLAYRNVKKLVPSDYLSNLTETYSYRSKICDFLFEKLKLAVDRAKQKEFKEKTIRDFSDLSESKLDENIIVTILLGQKSGKGQVKLFEVDFLRGYIDGLPEKSALKGRIRYDYQGTAYMTLEGIDYEEIAFENGKFEGVSKCYKNNQLEFSVKMAQNVPNEISYYQSGNLVKTTTFLPNNVEYSYEYKGNINLTLQALDEKIKEGNAFLKNEDFDSALSIFGKAANNTFPTTLPQNLVLKKNIESTRVKKIEYDERMKREYSKSLCYLGKFVCESHIGSDADWSNLPQSMYDKIKDKYAVLKFNSNGTVQHGVYNSYTGSTEMSDWGVFTKVNDMIVISWNDPEMGEENFQIAYSEVDYESHCLKVYKLQSPVYYNYLNQKMGGQVYFNR